MFPARIIVCSSFILATWFLHSRAISGIEDTLRDGAQQKTLSATALAWLSGSLCADTFLPPGKVADFFGFQYFRDTDECGLGHNSEFSARIADVVLETLHESQKMALLQLAYQEAGLPGAVNIDQVLPKTLDLFVYGRFPIQIAFRDLLEGHHISLRLDSLSYYLADFYEFDGKLSFERARTFAMILANVDEDQKNFLDSLGCMDTWPVFDNTWTKGLPKSESLLVKTYAGQLFSWYRGDLEWDAYFAPERVASYFGLFYLKDIEAVMHHDITIDEDETNNLGNAVLGVLTTEQVHYIDSLVESQQNDLNTYYELRRSVADQFRSGLSNAVQVASAARVSGMDEAAIFEAALKAFDDIVNYDQVLDFSRALGESDGAIAYKRATKFTELAASLSPQQSTSLHTLRDLDEEYHCIDGTGGFYFSDPVIFPVVSPEYVLAFFECSVENSDCYQQLYTQTEMWLGESLDNTVCY